ncbi:MAG: DUF1499 domain-containing protein [Allorhizobium sp.]
MTIRYDRPVSYTARAAHRLGFAGAGLLAIAIAAHRFGPLTTPDFISLVLISGFLAALALPLALIGLVRLWQVGALGGVAAGKGLFYAAIPLALLAYFSYAYVSRPPLFDVSTDLVDVPRWLSPPVANQQWLARPAETTAQMRAAQFQAYPQLTGRRYDGALDRVYQGVIKVAASSGFSIRFSKGQEYAMPDIIDMPLTSTGAQAPVDGPAVIPVPVPRPAPLPPQPPVAGGLVLPPGTVLIQAETRTLVLGLRFDVAIRLREEAETTLVDIRVASRYGAHDFGIGASIAEGFLHALDGELLGIAGN